MANRAYLFPADRADSWGFPRDRYYDSRWGIPLSWFFFYREPDIKRVDVAWKNSAWRELKFVAGKEAAIRLFEGRRPVLTAVVGRRIRAGVIDAFVDTIRGWSGDYLLMDPEEVLGELGDDEERDFESFSRILVAIDSGDLEAVLATAGRYVGELREDSDKCLVNIVGYTYW